jgi:ubiquinone biosynthesis monooxygenase Coq7
MAKKKTETHESEPPFLPGDGEDREFLERALRVNHAGEYGAQRIYAGQIAVLGESEIGDVLRHMAAQEEAHLAYFDRALTERGVRPTALHPFWHVAGYALGAATALMGKRAAMACTVAVEEAINEHYTAQAARLDAREGELREKVETFRREEMEHHDTALEHEAERAPGFRPLKAIIKLGCKAAIRLSERI